MFWRSNPPSSAQIETLLQKENVTLLELMGEEELLQECKVQNKRVVEFLTTPIIIEELVKIVVEDPCPEKELQIRFKHANLASELLTCDVPAIIDKLASSNLLLILYRYFEKEKPLNPLTASFVAKVLGMLVTRRTDQNWYSYQFTCYQVMEFLKSKGDFVDLAVRHIGTSAIMDLLSKLICGVDSDDHNIKAGIHMWLNDCHLVEKLVEKLSPECESEEHASVDQLLCELIISSRECTNNGSESQQNGWKSSLLLTLEGENTVNKLLDILLHENRTESSVSHVINILLALLTNKNSGYQSHFQHIPSIDLIKCAMDNRSVILTILSRLPEIQQILSNPFKGPLLLTSYGMEVERLGSMKLQITNLIVSLIATNDLNIHSKLAELSILSLLLNLFFKFSLNNFLHTQVTYCIKCILNNRSRENFTTAQSDKNEAQFDGLNNNPLDTKEKQHGTSENTQTQCCGDSAKSSEEENPSLDSYHPLLDQLFNDCSIVQRILDAHSPESDSSDKNKKSHYLKGYMGHLRDIANTIVECIQSGPNSEHIIKLIKALPEKISLDWEEFSQVPLAEINLKNKVITLQQSFRDSEMDEISDFTSAINYDFKDATDHIRQMTLNSECILQPTTQDLDFEEGIVEDDLFEKMCSDRKFTMDQFDEFWKMNEKEVVIDIQSPKVSEKEGDGAADSSSEEEGDLDEEFDNLRSKPEKMDIDEIPEDWPEVFERRDTFNPMDNPWKSAPASDIGGTLNWANFPSASPAKSEEYPFFANFDTAFAINNQSHETPEGRNLSKQEGHSNDTEEVNDLSSKLCCDEKQSEQKIVENKFEMSSEVNSLEKDVLPHPNNTETVPLAANS